MKKIDTVRALRDAEYRANLTDAELAALPVHPAGIATVADDVLKSISGGCGTITNCNVCPPTFCTTVAISCVPAGMNCP